MAITFTDTERTWLKVAAIAYARGLAAVPDHCLTAIAKLNNEFGQPDYELFKAEMPPHWHISRTGRKLKGADEGSVPITPKRYAFAEQTALIRKGAELVEKW